MKGSDKYRLVFEEHSDYFLACVEGEASTDELVAEYQHTIAEEIRRSRYRRIMIKRDLPDSHIPAEMYRIPFLVDPSNDREIVYAFVEANAVNAPSYKLALLDARARRLCIEIFTDVPSAERWLLEGFRA